MEGQGASHVKANHAAWLSHIRMQPVAEDLSVDSMEPPQKWRHVDPPQPVVTSTSSSSHCLSQFEELSDTVLDYDNPMDITFHAEPSLGTLEADAVAAAASAQQQTWAHLRWATVEDCSDDDKEENGTFDLSDDEYAEDTFTVFGDDEGEDGLSIEDQINEEFEQELAEFGKSHPANWSELVY